MTGAFDQPAEGGPVTAGLHRHPLRVGVLARTGTALTALLLPALHHPQLRLVWNASASVPLGLYRIEPNAVPRVGDLVAVRPSPALTRVMAERHYVEANALLVKPVAALAGATVCRTNMHVTLNGRAVATALPRDRFGRPLPRWSGCQRLACNQLLLIAPALRASFDSRYFGPIDRAQVIGRAVPLWTWL
ncbi:conjugative transfer signal peptidase TraF [Novosphingobium sp. SG751A]|uniref:S26 family signal peptidase n=1 Tax=Novosphingobium sp. SG751A TaxID=2587000 RepID=UPI0020A69EB5|nr:S26 family signal peptidase [Novosphingobium sp. SG751A]NOW44998.1 conjugative transfer signal peptidase TraF [Novosphingobium sp. SG751A]